MNGYTHWKIQRLTAIILLLLFPRGMTLFASIAGGVPLDSSLLTPLQSFALAEGVQWVLTFGILFGSVVHIRLGGEVILEDYVHGEAVLAFSLVLLRLLSLGTFQVLYLFLL